MSHTTRIDPWKKWLHNLFEPYTRAKFSPRHIEFWDWIERVELGVRLPPFVAIWPRGGAKSTSAELAVVRLGAKAVRRYVWYVSATQDKADKHVDTIAAMLESRGVEKEHPDLGNRLIGKYGNSKGWRRSRLRTASGFTVDALGLDTGARGAKVEEARPDLIVLDDVDEKHDSLAIVEKKIETITTSLLPAGSNDCAVLFIQNVIHPDSIAARLVDGRADFLADRQVSGPYPAVVGLTYELRHDAELERPVYRITGGEATWEGQSIEICQSQILQWGLSAFLQEAQHEVEQTGGIWDHIEFQHIEAADLPEFVRVAVWVDPAVTSTDDSDSMGICAGGLTERGQLVMLYAWEAVTSPVDALKRAIRKGIELGASTVGVETDQGGDTWGTVYQQACRELAAEMGAARFPAFRSDKAGAGYGSKVERNQRMLTDYESGLVLHATGTHGALERSLRRFPRKPLDLADAAFWVWNDLRGGDWFIS